MDRQTHYMHWLGLIILAALTAWNPLGAAVLDNFDGGTFNAGNNWILNQVIQTGNPSDTITYDQATNPGKLTITYDDTQGSDQTTLTPWTPDTLDVDEFVQVKVQILQGGGASVRVGLGLAPTATPTNRANTLQFGVRGDGIARGHVYADGGSEFADYDGVIAGYLPGDVITLRVVRSSTDGYQLYYGHNGPAETFIGSVTWPTVGGTPPAVPAILLDNGLADFVATFDDFEIGSVTPEPTPTPTATPTPLPTPPPPNFNVDLFGDAQLDAEWNTENYPQRSGELDTLTNAESGGRLRINSVDTQGSAQATFYLRGDVAIEPGETVQVDVRVVAGATDALVRGGLGLAPTASGIDNDRSSTIWFGIRNDGIMRGNYYGDAGVELGGVEPALETYNPGTDVITVILYRMDQFRYAHWYSQNGSSLQLAGVANYTGSTPPNVPGLFIGVGLSDMEIEYDNFRMYKILPNAARNWSVLE